MGNLLIVLGSNSELRKHRQLTNLPKLICRKGCNNATFIWLMFHHSNLKFNSRAFGGSSWDWLTDESSHFTFTALLFQTRKLTTHVYARLQYCGTPFFT